MKVDAFINGNREMLDNVTSVEFGYGNFVCVMHTENGVKNVTQIPYRAVNRIY